ncbi:V4R domain-containing protein [Methanobrevibacter sp.]|uniref:V4R domain-containing protein n=1 Tax=Methanobrevibacter sp. TaxID=66852 RepID=UPI0025D46264|nr:V4R domain-containing protein [Methanobrevibacter sp.]MBQ2666111.1 ArsR family transcriptional regulator [Methanobrevibacter sp.]
MTISNPIQIILNNNKTNHPMVDIDIIKSPMKYEILELLRHDEMNFEDIVKNTSKSKASVSMHLRDLRKEGIVQYKADPLDNRKKIFYLNSEYLGSIDSNRIKLAEKEQTKLLIDEFIQNGEIEYIILLTHTFKSLLFEFGMDISPVLQKVGNHIGEYLYEQLKDDDLDVFIKNISKYWYDNNLGVLSFNIKNNIEITCFDCFESMNSAKIGLPSCFLEKGMLETLFNNYFKFNLKILETKCYSMGDDRCVYELEP